MVGEIIVEAIAFVALLIVAFVFGQKRVRLVDRLHVDEDEFIIAPPRRDKYHAKAARELNSKFKEHNRTADIETETLICLPSETSLGILAAIEAFVMALILAFNHFDGISQFMIGEKIYGNDRLFEGNIGAILVLLFAILAFGVLFYNIAENAMKARAFKKGELRAKKRRTVRFVQALGIDEIGARLKWAVAEEIEESKIRRAQKHRKQVVVRKAQPSNNNIIKLPTAINN